MRQSFGSKSAEKVNGKDSAELPTGDKIVPNGRNIRALLVDDSLMMLSALGRILGRERRITLINSATDGWLALRIALESRPDLVLIDLNLPSLNGAEVTRYLKLLPNPPIVFMVTSDESSNALAASKAAGADAFIIKAANLETQIRSKL
jgi:DNA-binding NarL/FixJ family response regulator